MRTQKKRVSLTPEIPTPRKPSDCQVEDWLTFLGHRWTSLLLWHLSVSPKRHGELAILLPGISTKVLAERLSALVNRGLIDKSQIATFPRTVNYALTEQGTQILAILNQIEIWSRMASPNLSFQPTILDGG